MSYQTLFEKPFDRNLSDLAGLIPVYFSQTDVKKKLFLTKPICHPKKDG